MTLETAKELIWLGALYGDVFGRLNVLDREELREWFLRTPGLPNRAARGSIVGSNNPTAPAPSGNCCPRCNGMLVRDGKCELCTQCGETVGSCS